MPDEPIEAEFTVRDDDAKRIVQAFNDQARDLLIHPPFSLNLIGSTELGDLSIIFEFQRTEGSAVDATVVELCWPQLQFIRKFLNEQLGEETEEAVIRRLYGPTKETTEDDTEA